MVNVLVIGIDGGSWDTLKPWAEAGHLPNIKRFLDEGFTAPLESVMPPVTIPAVPCIATGVNPGKHGVYSFLKRRENSYGEELVSAMDIKVRPFWEILDSYGVTCGVHMLPFTYPSKKLNHGFVISGFGVSKLEEGINPPELVGELRRNVPSFKRFEELATHELSEEFLARDSEKLVESSSDAMVYLLKEKDPDVFLAWFDECEKTQHMLWKYMDPRFPQYHSFGAAKYRGVVLKVAKETDKAIGRLLNEAGKDAHVLLVSDHGFGTVIRHSQYYTLTNWLMAKNFLSARDSARQRLFSILPYEFLYALVSKLGLNAIVKKVLPRKAINSIQENAAPSLEKTDWSRTRVYSQGNECFLFVNLKGREPQGIVAPPEYEAVKSDVIRELKKIREPRTGLATIAEVYDGKDVFKGRFAGRAPDIVVYPRELPTLVEGENLSAEPEDERPDRSWVVTWHHRDGILGVLGPSVIRKRSKEKETLLGIAPTILYLAGVPLPELDSKPFKAFTEGFSPKKVQVGEEHLLENALDESLAGL